MNQHQASGAADDPKDAKEAAPEPEAKPSGQAGAEPKGPARDKESRLRKAYGDIKNALKNSRHT